LLFMTNPATSTQIQSVPIDPVTTALLWSRRSSASEENFMDDRWLSVEDVAEYLGVSRDTVYAWVGSKGMPGHKVGRFWKFKRQEIDAWVRAGGAAVAAPEKGT
jgi:excisionase family DNA binding protein